MGSWDLAIALDRTNPEPLYLQLVKALEEGIRHGRFKPGDALPGTRALAELLGVNRNTTLAAYKELEAEGWIEVAPDRGTFVARKLPIIMEVPAGISAQDSASWKRATPRNEPFFQPGAPTHASFQLIPDTTDLRLAPTEAIHRAYGRILKLHPERLLQPGWDPRGLLDLRNSLCKMLRDMRGLSIEAGNLLLTRGLMSTLNLVSRVLFAPGDAVAVENPGMFRVAEAFRSAGARLFAVPVDAHGLDVEALEALLIQEPIRLLYLTASPQHPHPGDPGPGPAQTPAGAVQGPWVQDSGGRPQPGFSSGEESRPALGQRGPARAGALLRQLRTNPRPWAAGGFPGW